MVQFEFVHCDGLVSDLIQGKISNTELSFLAPCKASTQTGASKKCDLIVDGDTSTTKCASTKTQSKPWMWVDLGDFFWVSQVIMVTDDVTMVSDDVTMVSDDVTMVTDDVTITWSLGQGVRTELIERVHSLRW